jgi:hypothetical protein
VVSIDEDLANDSDSDEVVSRKYRVVRRVMMRTTFQTRGLCPSVYGFCKKDRKPSIPLFTGNPAVQFAVQNGTDMMEYVDNYITPELIQFVVNQTNLYAQQQIMTMPPPVTKKARSEQWKPVTIYEMKFLGLMFLTGVIRKPKLEWYWSTRGILLNTHFLTNSV